MNADGQTEYRSCVAKLLHIGFQSRPDVCFEAKCLSTVYGKAKKSDLKLALKKMQKLQQKKLSDLVCMNKEWPKNDI